MALAEGGEGWSPYRADGDSGLDVINPGGLSAVVELVGLRKPPTGPPPPVKGPRGCRVKLEVVDIAAEAATAAAAAAAAGKGFEEVVDSCHGDVSVLVAVVVVVDDGWSPWLGPQQAHWMIISAAQVGNCCCFRCSCSHSWHTRACMRAGDEICKIKTKRNRNQYEGLWWEINLLPRYQKVHASFALLQKEMKWLNSGKLGCTTSTTIASMT